MTSLAPSKELDNQIKAISSWQKIGFQVIAMNTSEEIATLETYFKDVIFVRASKDAKNKFGKPYIYFDDVLGFFKASDFKICGIVNSDIHLLNEEFLPFVSKEAINSLVYGHRMNVESLDSLNHGEMDKFGFDYFFFDKEIIEYYPKSELCLGLPFWDWWMVLIPLFYRVSVKKVMTAHAYHLNHPLAWGWLPWMPFLHHTLLHYIQPMTASAIQQPEQQILKLMQKYSKEIGFDEMITNDAAVHYQDIKCKVDKESDIRILDDFMLKVLFEK